MVRLIEVQKEVLSFGGGGRHGAQGVVDLLNYGDRDGEFDDPLLVVELDAVRSSASARDDAFAHGGLEGREIGIGEVAAVLQLLDRGSVETRIDGLSLVLLDELV
jgi:hypothetical protein